MALAARTNALEVPESGMSRVSPGEAPRVSMSQRLWDIDWKSILPWHFDDVRVEYERLADVLPFMAEVFPQTFNVGRQWLQEEMTEAKRRFGEEMDVFVFRAEAKIVGVIVAHPLDWSTYYWRVATILPEYRQRNLVASLAEPLYARFREAGVKRMEVDTSPANRPMVRLLSNQGFIVTSTSSSERWGLSLRFTKFLDDEAERIYRGQFLDVPANTTTERSRP
ncbi:MAG: GNAT family N-acetyltransferase [Myxococcales bacterium]|nr:GNAT family N-acetyltransferase [Myxococcales bacterium]